MDPDDGRAAVDVGGLHESHIALGGDRGQAPFDELMASIERVAIRPPCAIVLVDRTLPTGAKHIIIDKGSGQRRLSVRVEVLPPQGLGVEAQFGCGII